MLVGHWREGGMSLGPVAGVIGGPHGAALLVRGPQRRPAGEGGTQRPEADGPEVVGEGVFQGPAAEGGSQLTLVEVEGGPQRPGIVGGNRSPGVDGGNLGPGREGENLGPGEAEGGHLRPVVVGGHQQRAR